MGDNNRAWDLSLVIVEKKVLFLQQNDSACRNLACVSDSAFYHNPWSFKGVHLFSTYTHEQDSTQPSSLHKMVVKPAKRGLLRALFHVWAL